MEEVFSTYQASACESYLWNDSLYTVLDLENTPNNSDAFYNKGLAQKESKQYTEA
ncbi:hypothetical protein N9Y89_02375 [bacterium]|nr:hypothetical protein [bacterium]